MAVRIAEHGLRPAAILIGLLAATGLFLGLVGPFGSYFSGPAWQRIGYWTGMSVAGGLPFGAAAWIILRRGWSYVATGAALLAAALLLANPFAAIVSVVAVRLWPQLRAFGPEIWYAQVVAIAVPLTLAFGLGRKALGARGGADDAPKSATPRALGVDSRSVLCLQMEDHYVRVHTAAGSRLVLATLQQAIASVENGRGLQVHRSWWVANDAVAEVLSDGRNLRLRLTNGVVAPVARSAVAAVREAGWLSRGIRDQAAAT